MTKYYQNLSISASRSTEQYEIFKEWLRETCLSNAQKAGYEIIGEPTFYADTEPDKQNRIYFEWSVEVK